jgi:hypothetical protein
MPRPVEVECRGEVVVVVPGATAEFPLASVPDGSEGAG